MLRAAFVTLMAAPLTAPDERRRSSKKATAFVLAVLAVASAGCASTQAPKSEAGRQGDGTLGGVGVSAAGALVPARFANASPFSMTMWYNGTLDAQGAGRPPAPAPGVVSNPQTTLRTIDVSVVAGVSQVPLILVAEVKAQMSQGDVDLWFDIPQEEARNGAFDTPRGGYSHVEQGLVRATTKPITLNLYYDEAEPATSVPYTLWARAQFDPTVVPGAFPVGLTVKEGVKSVEIEKLGERRTNSFDLDPPNVMLWGPDDAFLGHHALTGARTTIDLPDARGGEYVLILSQGARSMRILAPSNATLRAMPQQFVIGEPRTGASPTEAKWTVERTKVPVLAGVLFSPSNVATDVSVKLASPAGTLVDDKTSGAGPFLTTPQTPAGGFSNRFWWDSGYGVPALVAGTYSASVTFDQAAGSEPVKVQDVAAFWSR